MSSLKRSNGNDPLWYKDAIIYELHVRTFFDGNNDGIGDFPGLIQKLDYLQTLGVTCLWLLPFFPSPLRDDGYDIADYTNVHPSYGTFEDFQTFLEAAHERKLQVGDLNAAADAEPEALYPAGDGNFEFQRTVSRLEEMQSQDYLEAGHGSSG